MDRCALFVDAGYALADGAMAVHGTRRRDSVSWDHAGLLKLLAGLARDRTGLPVLRCYWYETAAEGRRTTEHDALAEMPGLKLRLVNALPGRREGIESQLRRDLVTLAKSGAISDAFIASANEHIAEIVSEVQDLGLRVVILHISSDGGWTIPLPLRQECDDIVEISGVHLRSFVDLIKGAEPVSADDQHATGQYGGRGMDTKGVVAGALAQASPVAALPASGVVYHVPDGGDGAVSQQDGSGQLLNQTPYAMDGSGALAGPYLGAPAQSDHDQRAGQSGAPVAQGQSGPDQSRAGVVGQGPNGQQPGLTSSQGRTGDQSPYAPAGYQPAGEGQNGFRTGASQGAGPGNGVASDNSHRPSTNDFLNAAPYQADGTSAYQNGGSAGYQNGGHRNGVPPPSNGLAQGASSQRDAMQQDPAHHDSMPIAFGHNAGPNGSGLNGSSPNAGVSNGNVSNGSGVTGQASSAVQNGAAQFGFAAGQSIMGQQTNGQSSNGQPSTPPGHGVPPQNLASQSGPLPGIPSHGLTGLNGNGVGPNGVGPNGSSNPGPGHNGAGHNGAGHNGAGHNGAGLVLNGSGPNNLPQPAHGPGGFQPGSGQPLPGQLGVGQPGLGPQPPGHLGAGHSGPIAVGTQGDPRGGDPYGHSLQPGQPGQPVQSGLPVGFDGPPISLPGQPAPGPHGQSPHSQSPHSQSPHGQSPHGQSPYSQSPYSMVPPGPGGPQGPGQNGAGLHAPGPHAPGQNGFGPQGTQGTQGPAEIGYGQPPAGADQAQRAGFSQLPPGQLPSPQYQIPQQAGPAPHQGPGGQPGGQLQPMRAPQPVAIALPDAVKAAHTEGFTFGESVGRDAPGLWLEAVLARKPRMPSDLEARLLQGSVLPIDSLLHDEVRHSLRRGFWDALENTRR